ncbi:hypothetical protein CLI64_25970 [Nostoc sp. CENA543]|uniref:hypothetical protein n=1 Tax=Nostoc sp. CENA543 TaxID=1869241 RepID=UPI000CA1AB49|nr:hypothetical protein [Nostoc sp. CENA543]AUT03572.1 hypothetical protein CLI64_25970 [Nostoc sp. CENA543]
MLFSRTELELLTIPQLKMLCNRYGLKPTGNPGYKTAYITTLMAFPALALKQLEDGRGLKFPTFVSYQAVGSALEEMGTPTTEQSALIRISLEGKSINHPEKYGQQKLIALYNAKDHLERAISLLEIQ